MRKNSKNEKVIRAMAIGISAMLMASSPLTALAAEGEGNSSEGNEDMTALYHFLQDSLAIIKEPFPFQVV